MLYQPYAFEGINPFDNQIQFATGEVMKILSFQRATIFSMFQSKDWYNSASALIRHIPTGWQWAAGIQARTALSDVFAAIAWYTAKQESEAAREARIAGRQARTALAEVLEAAYLVMSLDETDVKIDEWQHHRNMLMALINHRIGKD